METYYHYTTPQNAEAIMNGTPKVIKKSMKSARRRRDDAVMGSGVYLTKMPPSRAKQEIALNNYDGVISRIKDLLATGKSSSNSSNNFSVSKWF